MALLGFSNISIGAVFPFVFHDHFIFGDCDIANFISFQFVFFQLVGIINFVFYQLPSIHYHTVLNFSIHFLLGGDFNFLWCITYFYTWNSTNCIGLCLHRHKVVRSAHHPTLLIGVTCFD